MATSASAPIGIRCFFPNCNEPVIGQCQGFPEFGGCGQFYCATHSEGRLCGSCAEIPRIIQDYQQTAEKIGSGVGCTRPGCLIAFGALMLFGAFMTFAMGDSQNYWVALLWVTLPFGYLFYTYRQRRTLREKAAEIDKEKPGFAEFYADWLSMKVSQRQEKMAGIANIVGGTVSTVVQSDRNAKWERTRVEVEDAARKINRYF